MPGCVTTTCAVYVQAPNLGAIRARAEWVSWLYARRARGDTAPTAAGGQRQPGDWFGPSGRRTAWAKLRHTIEALALRRGDSDPAAAGGGAAAVRAGTSMSPGTAQATESPRPRERRGAVTRGQRRRKGRTAGARQHEGDVGTATAATGGTPWRDLVTTVGLRVLTRAAAAARFALGRASQQ